MTRPKLSRKDLTDEWDERNRRSILETPASYSAWWRCAVAPDHKWKNTLEKRFSGQGCPFCQGRRASSTNNFADRFPDLAKEWHPTLNGTLTPRHVTRGSSKKTLWFCSQGHAYQQAPKRRAKGQRCGWCHGDRKDVVPAHRSLAKRNPDIACEWHPTKNTVSPPQVTHQSKQRVWWLCPIGHEYEAQVSMRTRKDGKATGCPRCAFKYGLGRPLHETHPDVAAQFHPTLNGELTVAHLTHGMARRVWWKCPAGLDHEWVTPVFNRTMAGSGGKGSGCPACASPPALVSVTNCLATRFPDVAAEWHPTKNGSLTPNKVTGAANRKVWWRCRHDPSHEWRALISNRTGPRSGCNKCTTGSRSRTELVVAFELKAFLDFDIDDTVIEAGDYSYMVDIKIPKHELVVEYDGWRWHRERLEQDRAKSAEIERAGFTVLRLREKKGNSELPKIGPDDFVASPKHIKSAIVHVLRFVERRSGRALEGLNDYCQRPNLVNQVAAERYIRDLLALNPRRRKHLRAKPVRNHSTGEVFESGYTAARTLGLANLDKVGVAARTGWKCAGHYWAFV